MNQRSTYNSQNRKRERLDIHQNELRFPQERSGESAPTASPTVEVYTRSHTPHTNTAQNDIAQTRSQIIYSPIHTPLHIAYHHLCTFPSPIPHPICSVTL